MTVNSSTLIRRLLWGLLIVCLVAVIGTSTWLKISSSSTYERLPVMHSVPDFTLTERSGHQFGLADLQDKIWVADFIFTNCAGTCPVMTTQMNELQTELSEQQMQDVKLVSFTVDPKTDTPEVLQKFAHGYNASSERWFFLTGAGEDIQHLATKGFYLSAATGDAGTNDEIVHSIRFVLVDRQGRIRGYYDGTDTATVKKIMADIQNLLEERMS